MVTYTLDKYNGDKSRVFVTGTSSGAMMTVGLPSFFLLLLSYPLSLYPLPHEYGPGPFFLDRCSCRIAR